MASRLEEISASYQKSQYEKTLWKTFFSWDIAHRYELVKPTLFNLHLQALSWLLFAVFVKNVWNFTCSVSINAVYINHYKLQGVIQGERGDIPPLSIMTECP